MWNKSSPKTVTTVKCGINALSFVSVIDFFHVKYGNKDKTDTFYSKCARTSMFFNNHVASGSSKIGAQIERHRLLSTWEM